MPSRPFAAPSRHASLALVVLVLLAVAWIYAPVRHAGFVWDDWPDFHDTAWLREGDAWMHYVLKDFNGWTNYFRPLGVLLFTAEVRLFASQPGPMHIVSLALHLVDSLLVFFVATRFARSLHPDRPTGYTPVVAMALYGLHPALIEVVAWIGCQFEMLLTLFILLGLWASMAITHRWRRALAIAACFFLAAGSKESAAAFPLLLVLFDWTLQRVGPEMTPARRIRGLLASYWPSYLGILLAGIVYLVIRHAALGMLFSPRVITPLSVLGHIQEVSYLYLQNWRMLLWPMTGMSPIHPVDTKQFAEPTASLIAASAATLATVALATWRVIGKPPGIATLVLAVTLALLPVLHIIAADFDSSLYHERYVMVALAAGCVLLPALTPVFGPLRTLSGAALPGLALLFGGWLAISSVTIRTTLPLWANDTNLWQWALAMYPDSMDAKDNLLGAYLQANDLADAHALIDRLKDEQPLCVNCMLNAAVLAVREGDPATAEHDLGLIRDSRLLAVDRQMFGKYMLTMGQMLFLQGKAKDAAAVLEQAVAVEPLDPEAALSLAIVEAGLGDCDRSAQLQEHGIMLLPQPARQARRSAVDKEVVAASSVRGRACRPGTAATL